MKKPEFIKAVADRAELTQKQTKEILDVMETVLCEVLKNGDEVTVMGTKFSTKIQKGRDGISPSTGQPYHTEDKVVPKLKATATLKKAVL